MGSFSYITLIIETAAAWAVLFAIQIPLRTERHCEWNLITLQPA